MEDQNLIVAVCSRPVLYNTRMVSYRDRNKKERAWVDVAEDTGCPDQPSSESETEDTAPAPAPAPAPVPAAGPSRVPVPEAGPAPRPQSGTKRKRARVPEGNTNIQTAILQALQRQNAVPTPTPLSGIEHFLMGLVPSLERMPPEVLEYVQFQIRKVIFDNTNFTLNLEPV
ncbi:uncharacterized protein LOC115530030 isoform X2 [Gadus morhua]|uniref:uncharacterized protein LOC115530030 isoform X2 n=1 Tax=Gadus morhua TaxID=8049 RepID=UPI0011B79DF8|nr:uncharacterized protein LOC115530030 isoform X2 [Gadus morhua]